MLRDEFNFPSRKATVNCLSKLRVPVRKYTLYYLLYNHARFKSYVYSDLVDKYEFNTRNLRFSILYHQLLPTQALRDRFLGVFEGLFVNGRPLTGLEKEFGIHHELLTRCREFFLDRKILT